MYKMSKMKLPYEPEAEKALLGCALLNDNCMDLMIEYITVDDFHVPINKRIYETIKKLINEQKPVDKVMIHSEVRDDQVYKDHGEVLSDKEHISGGLEYLTHIIGAYPRLDSIDHYIDLLKDCTIRRNIAHICKEMYHAVQSNEDTGATIASRYSTQLSEIDKASSDKPWALKTLESYEHWLTYKDDQSKYPHWVFEDLHKQLGPLLGFELVIVAAITGIGKTQFTLQDACYKAQTGIPVVFYSAEMNVEAMGARVVRIDTTRKMKEIPESERNLVVDSLAKWQELPLEIIAETRYESICASIRRLHRNNQCRIAYVDFLQYLTIPAVKNENEERQLSRMVLGYASLAKELGIDIVLVSQFNRNAGSTGYPTKRDLRGSGNIENYADQIVLLYPPNASDSLFEDEIWAVTEKNRDGITGGRTSLEFNKIQGLFYPRPMARPQIQGQIND
jgi:replicative DNA helicase